MWENCEYLIYRQQSPRAGDSQDSSHVSSETRPRHTTGDSKGRVVGCRPCSGWRLDYLDIYGGIGTLGGIAGHQFTKIILAMLFDLYKGV